jgi:hypothetical protein
VWDGEAAIDVGMTLLLRSRSSSFILFHFHNISRYRFMFQAALARRKRLAFKDGSPPVIKNSNSLTSPCKCYSSLGMV